MKKIFTIIAFICLTATNIACSSDDDNANSFPYTGSWSGTFTGDDTGTWEVAVNENGEVDGIFISSQFPDFQIPLQGNVNDAGQVEATYGNDFISGQFNGEMNGNTASGEWINDEGDFSGTWEGSKE